MNSQVFKGQIFPCVRVQPEPSFIYSASSRLSCFCTKPIHFGFICHISHKQKHGHRRIFSVFASLEHMTCSKSHMCYKESKKESVNIHFLKILAWNGLKFSKRITTLIWIHKHTFLGGLQRLIAHCWHNIWRNFGISILPKDTLACECSRHGSNHHVMIKRPEPQPARCLCHGQSVIMNLSSCLQPESCVFLPVPAVEYLSCFV